MLEVDGRVIGRRSLLYRERVRVVHVVVIRGALEDFPLRVFPLFRGDVVFVSVLFGEGSGLVRPPVLRRRGGSCFTYRGRRRGGPLRPFAVRRQRSPRRGPGQGGRRYRPASVVRGERFWYPFVVVNEDASSFRLDRRTTTRDSPDRWRYG